MTLAHTVARADSKLYIGGQYTIGRSYFDGDFQYDNFLTPGSFIPKSSIGNIGFDATPADMRDTRFISGFTIMAGFGNPNKMTVDVSLSRSLNTHYENSLVGYANFITPHLYNFSTRISMFNATVSTTYILPNILGRHAPRGFNPGILLRTGVSLGNQTIEYSGDISGRESKTNIGSVLGIGFIFTLRDGMQLLLEEQAAYGLDSYILQTAMSLRWYL
jgi:hypothetical protein